ncbi:ABC transporter ATP-binding protein [Bradyrhizobium sp. WSM3983]|uniref:ABC transporter ATP-binding protein n=1 Tax=Bradyrhizobium sp. WSM3983 TaxID=1038867 RepID=UPI00041615C2|nr:ABC transporter ATP-binding protein [Bradyrhizobium sp. WSM3983]
MAEVLLSAKGLGVRFGSFQAIEDLDLSIMQGALHSVIGPNGAGKTTLFNALSGARTPTQGEIKFREIGITNVPAHRRVHLGLSRSFQLTNIFRDLSVAENICLALQAVAGREAWAFWRSRDPSKVSRERAAKLAHTVGLSARFEARAGDLSHGAQRALEIAMALASDPKLLFLDEPLAGMGLDDVHRTKLLIKSLTPERTVVLIEHNMSVVLDISDRITVLAQGKKIAEGSPQQIRTNVDVKNAYLGSAA